MLVTHKTIIKGDEVPVFSFETPKTQTNPFLFNSPHSGSFYPDHFLAASKLDPMTLRKTEDAYVNELYHAVLKLGSPLLHAHFPRSFVDLNREPYELDNRLLNEPLPAFANACSTRVRNGLGTIARLVSEHEEIYDHSLSLATMLERIDNLYKPYHAKLRNLLDSTTLQWGIAVLIDCHSMPSLPATTSRHQKTHQAEIILGDCYGRSCNKEIIHALKEALSRHGLKVALNKPYAGGYITKHYGKPERGQHAVQIEINRNLYMDEHTLVKKESFSALAKTLTQSLEEVIEIVTRTHVITRYAAE